MSIENFINVFPKHTEGQFYTIPLSTKGNKEIVENSRDAISRDAIKESTEYVKSR